MTLPLPVLCTANHAALVPQLAEIHAACVLHDHQLATYLPDASGDMDMSKLLDFWSRQITDQSRLIVLQFTDDTESEIIGCVCLHMPLSETGPFRASVEKLLVSPKHRYKGIARRLMKKLEDEAKLRERYLLMLDTTIGFGADKVYPKLGYIQCGMIPKYGISPKDGSLVDELFFYKDLRSV
ncbi:acyl-CoA N-acyltransferase [Piedraia hortae CBS 480.64]|uniref:Acyl-CoA N-acyltransferase n=1 Tax=Piedraia hortae CBS 480.64 TaxID=1314780 RepID=A0A6A7BQP1_9PEZI|nr:acyl-CoA N-acyltransferase [Piedraia hortae CBS 480.64]